MNEKCKLSLKLKLFLLFAISLNCYNIYSQVDNKFDTEKLKILFHYKPEEKVNEFIKLSTELQVKFIEDDDRIIVSKNNKKCVLTEYIYNSILEQKKVEIIEQTSNSVSKWRIYYKQQSKIAVSLTKHIQAYKSRLMNKTRLLTWQKETKECISIQEKMDKIPFASSSNFYYQLETEENQVHSGILDIMNASRNIMGI